MKHTPAPWNIGTESLIVRSSDGENYIADCGVSYSLSDEQMKANARLVSAAPELLEALENFVTVCDSAPPIELVRYIAESCEKARAVIKKAKGETP